MKLWKFVDNIPRIKLKGNSRYRGPTFKKKIWVIRGVSRKPCQTSKMAYFAKKVDGFFSGREGGGGGL